VSLPTCGEVWWVDLGLAAKTRPCLVLSVRPGDAERDLVTLVPHTTSVRASRFEAAIPVPFLRPGAFDAQSLVTVPRPKLQQRIGALKPEALGRVEGAVRAWLGLAGSE
jgi:mRNA interferase MazF